MTEKQTKTNNEVIKKEFDLTNKPNGTQNETFEYIYNFIKMRYKNTKVSKVNVEIKDKSTKNSAKQHEKFDVSVAPLTNEDEFHFIYEKVVTRKNSGSLTKKSKVIKEKKFTIIDETTEDATDCKETKKVSWEMGFRK